MQESRLFQIIYYLLDHGHATAPELAAYLEVSTRTIYRDIDSLSGAGIPIYAETGRNGGIYLMDHFVLDKAVLSKEEKEEMLFTLQSLSATGGVLKQEVLSKLSALFQVSQPSWFEVDFSRWGNHEQDHVVFDQLKQGILQHQVLQITYVSTNGTTTTRKIQPYKLQYKSHAWYVKAYCMKANAVRIFKCSRIVSITVLNEFFTSCEYEEDIQPAPVMTDIKLNFPITQAYRVYDEFHVSEITKTDAHLHVETRLPLDAWIIVYLLSFGTEVDVIAPEELKQAYIKEIKKLYEKYKYA